ncbi:hypothetical protein [Myroides odoratus]|uniref:hypothetical protein n=1 Tax=Myroides odoratus TaxID=256 RepID=UPI0015F0BC2F|nr:hypothetical protein [Myroides odoratus]QQU04196.1 hypothetical protein I6I89_02600 [Myroides odoratus]
MNEKLQYVVTVYFRYGDHVNHADITVLASSPEEAKEKASLPPCYKIYEKHIF